MHDNLHALAQNIAVAEASSAQAAAGASDAQGHHDALANRIAELAAERVEIRGRRAAGDQGHDDGARLALIAADLEGLQALSQDAQTVLVGARNRAAAARSALVEAQNAYAAEEGRMTLQALDNHADHLLELLRNTIVQRHAAASALPPVLREFERGVQRIQALDGIMLGEIQVLRAIRFRDMGRLIEWHPTEGLYGEIYRLHHGQGRFV